MIYIVLNLIPILLAMLAGLSIGFVWLRASGILLPGWHAIALTGLAELWLAAILAGALILAPSEAGAWVMALGSAVVIWIGFVVPALMVTAAVWDVRFGSAVSAVLHWLAVMLAQAGVMQWWGLTLPQG